MRLAVERWCGVDCPSSSFAPRPGRGGGGDLLLFKHIHGMNRNFLHLEQLLVVCDECIAICECGSCKMNGIQCLESSVLCSDFGGLQCNVFVNWHYINIHAIQEGFKIYNCLSVIMGKGINAEFLNRYSGCEQLEALILAINEEASCHIKVEGAFFKEINEGGQYRRIF